VIADVDSESIEQVLSNLLDNALKYSPEGGRICVEVGSISEGQIFIAVRDHGIGIAPERRGSIFERFYQAHADDHRSGLGLGLYISQQIIAQHGGEMIAEFPPDGGTRFVVRLPVHATSTARAAKRQP
jgi:signal transduction histidine kinase